MRDPSAPCGPIFTSVSQWLQSNADGISQTTASESVANNTPGPPPVRVIVAEQDEDAVVTDNSETEEIGIENLGNPNVEDDEDGDNDNEDRDHDSDESTGSSSKDYPEWFSKLLEEKLELVSKQVNGKCTFYAQVENFWLPQKAGWFNMLQAKTLRPEAAYNPRWFYWDPLDLVRIKCPNFKTCQSFLICNTICKHPQHCVDLDTCFWMIGA